MNNAAEAEASPWISSALLRYFLSKSKSWYEHVLRHHHGPISALNTLLQDSSMAPELGSINCINPTTYLELNSVLEHFHQVFHSQHHQANGLLQSIPHLLPQRDWVLWKQLKGLLFRAEGLSILLCKMPLRRNRNDASSLGSLSKEAKGNGSREALVAIGKLLSRE